MLCAFEWYNRRFKSRALARTEYLKSEKKGARLLAWTERVTREIKSKGAVEAGGFTRDECDLIKPTGEFFFFFYTAIIAFPSLRASLYSPPTSEEEHIKRVGIEKKSLALFAYKKQFA